MMLTQPYGLTHVLRCNNDNNMQYKSHELLNPYDKQSCISCFCIFFFLFTYMYTYFSVIMICTQSMNNCDYLV